jgi:nitrogen fixation protein FixH
MREITGRQVLIGTVAAFGVIIAANLTLAVSAVRTFPGLEVKNSYEASQVFDRERAAQLALGWTVSAEVVGGELRLSITDAGGQPVDPPMLEAVFGKATHVKSDVTPDFAFVNGIHVAPITAAAGNWNLRLKAVAEDGTTFHQRIVVPVRS